MRRECVRSRVRVESVRIEYIGVYVDICEYYVGCETELGQIRGLETYNKRCGGLGSRPKKMYGERLGDGVEYHLMSPTPCR